jgi:hypothetical protein
VPRKWEQNPQLATWVNTVRQNNSKEKLSQDRIDKLNQLGFEWNTIEDAWNQMYQQLIAYQKESGHCNVPQIYSPNPQLGIWVNNNRRKKEKLDEDKIYRLNQLGFSWNTIEDAWNQMYQQLIAYHKEYDHCNVPQSYPPNQKLATWVNKNRQNYRKKKLSQDRIDKLNQLGFEWTLKNRTKSTKPT